LGETEEGEALFSEIFPQNSKRVQAQRKVPLRVIMSNPPYSVGQKSANDNAQNQSYPKLEDKIAKTYASIGGASSIKALYDTYIKAFRWSTDRLDPVNGGIICFVSNGSWIDGNAIGGFRYYLEREFTSIHIYNLRGNCRTSGELRRKEAGNVFGLGSRTPISITLLVRNSKIKTEKAKIYYHDIGDYLSRDEKFNILKNTVSMSNPVIEWTFLTPNKYNDWLNKRKDPFNFIALAPDKKFNTLSKSFFVLNSLGLNSNRDVWVYNSNKSILIKNMSAHINFYNTQVREFKKYLQDEKLTFFDDFIVDIFTDKTASKISWSSSLISSLKQFKIAKIEEDKLYEAMYRPFFKQYLYYGDLMVHRRGQFEQLFPFTSSENLLVCVSGVGVTKDFSCIITNVISDLEIIGKSQCFPLYWYEAKEYVQSSLFEKTEDEYIRHDGISNFILDQAQSRYGHRVEKEDIFYYVYGILHSPEYRKTFSSDLKKMLPRLPLVEKTADFWSFSKAGRELAELHLNYEEQKPTKEVRVTGADKGNFIVNKMNFPAKGQKDTIIYNACITVSNIPAKAYEYIVNGKPAIEWIMERYAVTVHKESGIKNDPNDWAAEHNNPRYILDLLLSVITVSVKTVDIVAGLPNIAFEKLCDVEKDMI
jgi:predicted helicase